MAPRSLLIYFCILLQNLAHAKTVHHTFVVSYIVGSPDGVEKSSILGINGHFPGPTIEAEFGDTLIVDLVNLIQDGVQNVSLHWHGIHQHDSPFQDGTSQISQCPLKNGFVQKYTFQLKQAGTYWYHSHEKSQYTDGLWGALIVYNSPEIHTYNINQDVVIALNDWYHRSSHENEEWHLSPPSRGVPPYPDSAMMNGRGRYPCSFAQMKGLPCDPVLQTRPIFNVPKNETIRVRVINVSAVAAFNFSIDGHILEVIEVDGIDTSSSKRVFVDYAMIGAAQRYSFLIHTNNTEENDRFLIRADLRKESLLLVHGVNINQHPEALMTHVTGVLQYVNSQNETNMTELPNFEQFSYFDQVPERSLSNLRCLDEMDLSPWDGTQAPEIVDKEIILNVGFYEGVDEIRRGSFNKTPFRLPDHKPLLMSLLDGDEIGEESFPIEVDHMDVVQVIINNPFYGPHPFHLHGTHFWVLGSGLWFEGDYDPLIHNQSLSLSGVKRDTVMVQEQSWAVIRFIADNPGLWTFHCHIDWHNLSGMAATFIVGKELAKSTIKIPDEAKRVCSYHTLGKDKDEPNGGNIIRLNYSVVLYFSVYFLLQRMID